MTQHHHSTGDTSGPSWTSPAGHYMGQSQPWQGQSGPYYDPSQHYYDPNNPAAWQQSTQYPGGRPPQKPVYKQWWFRMILTVVIIGLVAIAFVLTTEENSDRDVVQPPGLEAPAAPLAPDNSTGMGESRVQRSDNGRFVLEDGGTEAQALAEAQERIDAGYSHYGPTDLMDVLRYDGYQNQAIEYALNNLDVDWNKQALGVGQRMGESEYGGYSAQEILQSLVRAGFIDAEVQYAMDNLDIDFNEQAVAALESYRDIFDDRTENEIREYLHHAGFQESEIDYAFDNID